MTPKRKVTLYLEPDTLKQLRRYVFDHECSMSGVVQLALERYLDNTIPEPEVWNAPVQPAKVAAQPVQHAKPFRPLPKK